MAKPEIIRTLDRSSGGGLLVRAAEMAVLRSVIDPGQALRAGHKVLEAAEKAGDGEAASVALRAMALASRELGDLQAAEQRLRQAVQTRGAPAERMAQARLSLVTVRTERGHPLQALRLAALAWAYLSPLDRAKLDTQRAVALAHLGRYQEAVASCDRALRALVAAPGTIDDRRFLAGGLLNRGLVHAYRGDWDQAMRDISACLQIAGHARLSHLERLAAANLPFLAVRRGDIGGAFTHYREAEDTLFGYPERLATMRADFAGALLAAHLPGEARALLSLAVPDLEESGAQVALAEARLKLAQVELLTGDAREAMTVAERAMRELSEQDRQAWLPLAREVVLRSRLALEPPTPGLLAELAGCADDLERDAAHLAEGASLRLTAAETALALGDRAAASAQLSRLTEQPGRERWLPPGGRRTPLASPAQAGYAAAGQVPPLVRQHALALEAALREDVPAAFRAVEEGLAGMGGQIDSLDDPSLRAHAARAGGRLAAFGLRLAVRDGCAEEVFEWAERWRAVTAPAHARSPHGAGLPEVRAALGRAALVEYVTDDSSLFAVVVTGQRLALRPLGALRPVKEALIRLRYSLRRSALHDGAAGAEPVAAAGSELELLLLAPLAAELGERPLVVVPTGILHTLPWAALPCLRERPVTVAASARSWLAATRDPAPLRTCRPPGPLVMTRPTGPPRTTSPETAATPPAGLAGTPAPGTTPPTAPPEAGTTPPTALPEARTTPPAGIPGAGHSDGVVLSGAAHPVGSSVDSWAGPSGDSWPGSLKVIAAAGPGLAHAYEERDRVVACHPGARPVAARRDAVLAALASCDVVHLAAHGVFHARSPLLSSITLEDGPLMAYDLLGSSRTARLVVLSACDSGMARTPTDGAPLGLAGAFLAQGTACVVAGMVPVCDEDALAVMSRFHELLAAGHTPASALAYASARTGITAFTCFGAGDQPLIHREPDAGCPADIGRAPVPVHGEDDRERGRRPIVPTG
ncbi:CHAT domain-containing protein [Nonomuraea sp. C10]|uniref:CHAT domain-containing protein n=1 Tax=Nonomuraea sp. C10 TaxID=2600577 RepID=UPI0011CE7715|nr:CHAT domain-containing tetratricopeptide repeat protein [Nonomuraea sp. C10]TXK39366.1 CHAT domain-containing protein [Nonomuraea sp. C10]